jgi:phospholipid/cholesterol/gamma-HCH transport system substrate-binding protein
MRRILAIVLALLGLGLLVALPATGDDDGPYLIRAAFDNGAFVANGEEVRIAGARVGSVQSVSVSTGDEVVSLENGEQKLPGKAILVLKIDDDGFKDFRTDATCRIRPQSLLGEKYVDCQPTQPRAPGSPAPPELSQIPDGEPGAGERLLPLENNGTSVDLDLFNNINRLPYRERFRLILNELGAGVAGRGKELGEVIDRADPALQQTDRVLAILAAQNQQLASLAANGDASLEPLAREREHITGFLANANVVNEATAAQSSDLEAGLHKLPRLLHELRLTMKDLRGVTDNATPVFADTGAVAKDISRATVNLGPFARAGIPAIESLGDAGEEAGPKIVAADPLTVDLTKAAVHTPAISKNLKGILRTFEQTNGIKHLLNFVRYSTTAANGFDNFGHFLRTDVLVTSCIDAQPAPLAGCITNFPKTSASSATTAKSTAKPKATQGELGAAQPAPGITTTPLPELTQPLEGTETTPDDGTTTTPEPPTGGDQTTTTEQGQEPVAGTSARKRRRHRRLIPAGIQSLQPQSSAFDMESTQALLTFLLGTP